MPVNDLLGPMRWVTDQGIGVQFADNIQEGIGHGFETIC
jgi:hypothetical protein